MAHPKLEAIRTRREARDQLDRTFDLAGETLKYVRSVLPEVVFRFRESQRMMFEDLYKQRIWSLEVAKLEGLNGDAEAETIKLGPIPTLRQSDREVLEVADETILELLEDESHEAWARLRSGDNPQPLTFDDVFDVIDYLIEAVTQTPTDAPTDSSDGRKGTAKPSKAASSSRAKTRPGSD